MCTYHVRKLKIVVIVRDGAQGGLNQAEARTTFEKPCSAVSPARSHWLLSSVSLNPPHWPLPTVRSWGARFQTYDLLTNNKHSNSRYTDIHTGQPRKDRRKRGFFYIETFCIISIATNILAYLQNLK